MNFLAHFFLSFDNSSLLLGQYMGDFVKGSHYNRYEPEVQQGILLHRYVDDLTDHSPLTQPMRDQLREPLGRYSGIALDVFYDHFLSRHWNTFHTLPLDAFIAWVYHELSKHQIGFTAEMNYLFGYMKKYDWLGRYQSTDGIERTLHEMAKRLPTGNTLMEAPTVLTDRYEAIEASFLGFFPQLIANCKVKLDTFANQR